MCLRITWARSIYLLGIALGTLQLWHMWILSRLDKQSNMGTEETQVGTYDMEETISRIYPVIQQSSADSSVIDSSGNYRIIYNIFQARKENSDAALLHKKFGVTLVTHCTINHVHHLLELSKQWQGPISMAIFVPSAHKKFIIEAVLLLSHCIPQVTYNISIHLVFPLNQDSFDALLPSKPVISSTSFKCQDLQSSLEALLQKGHQNYELDNEKYPNNLLRNSARRMVNSRYVMTTDVDLVPSENLYQNFIDFIRRMSFTSENPETVAVADTVYVLAAFEIQRNILVPRTKQQLLHLWERGNLRPFYHELCSKCQKHTNYRAWKNLTYSKGLSAAYSVDWKDPWEPFYIGPTASLPLYDERFKQYGFNRISQVCETHIAGFQFEVLDNAFLVHLGLKTTEGFHHSKDQEQEHNRILFRQFKEELKTKYPDTDKRCY